MARQFPAKVSHAILFFLVLAAPAPAEEPARLPLLNASWHVTTLPRRVHPWVNDYVNRDLDGLVGQWQPIVPASVPVIADGRLMFRNCDGIEVRDLKALNKDGPYWWCELDGGIHTLFSDPNRAAILEQWQATYQKSGPPGVLFRNSLTGSLSTDGQRAFVVDDLLLPPPALLRGQRQRKIFGALDEQVHRNTLNCYNLESGKLVWALGARFYQEGPIRKQFDQTFFLGPPLPLDGKLYVLNEKAKAIRLACLQAKDTIDNPQPPELLWIQPLVAAKEKLCYDPGRRLHAAAIADADGILICLTNAGTIAAVDRATHKVRWKYEYQPQQGTLVPCTGWKDAAIRVRDGKVIFTAPDGPAIYCIKLSDGSLVWKADRGNDLYLAEISGGKVVLVGPKACRALRLLDGKPAWRREIGVPSGRGVADRFLYYLPLEAGESGKPEIAILDMATGTRAVRLPVPGAPPGNLVLTGDKLVSQTVRDVAVYDLARFVPKQLARSLSAQELEEFWEDLLRPDRLSGRRAGWLLAATPAQTVPFLKGKARLIPAADRKRIARLVADLNDRKFLTRQKAAEELEKLGERAEPALRNAVLAKPPLETRQRLERLLAPLDRSPSVEKRRTFRVVELLENMGTAEARQILDGLADHEPDTLLTQAARLARQRLAKRSAEKKTP